MNRFLSIASYLFVAVLGGVCFMAIFGHTPAPTVAEKPACMPVLVAVGGDEEFHLDQVCSDADVVRIYGETRLLEKRWMDDHDCESDDSAVRFWRSRVRQ